MVSFRRGVFGIAILAALLLLVNFGAEGAARVLLPLFGGTGTNIRFTSGSVVFAGPSNGIYAQDNADFNYNSTTNILTAAGGVTTSGPISGTTVTGTTGSFTTAVSQTGANGQKAEIKSLTELTTIAAAATTDTAIQIPANAIVLGVATRVTTVIPTAATFTVIGAGTSTAFQTGATVSTAATTTDAGTKACPYLNTTAQAIRITPNATPGANTGRVRVTIFYVLVTPPTS